MLRSQAAAQLLASLALAASCTADAARAPLEAGAACAVVMKAIAKQQGVPESGPPEAGWFCEFGEASDPAFHVIALKASRPIPTGKLLGWYAVARASGELFEWDVKTRRALPLKASGARPR